MYINLKNLYANIQIIFLLFNIRELKLSVRKPLFFYIQKKENCNIKSRIFLQNYSQLCHIKNSATLCHVKQHTDI